MKTIANSRHERAIMAALIVLAALAPASIVFAHRGVAPIVLAMGLAVGTRARPWSVGVPYFLTRPDLNSPLVRAALLFGAFTAWAMATGLWAPRADAFRLGLSVFLPVIAGGAVVFEISRRPLASIAPFAAVLAWGAALAIVLLLFEAATSGWLHLATPPADLSPGRYRDIVNLGRGTTIISIILFPAVSLIYLYTNSRFISAALVAAAFLAALRFGIFSNVAAIVFGAAVFLAAKRWPQELLKSLSFAAIAALLLSPLAAVIPVEQAIDGLSGAAPVSWLQRLAIWRTAAAATLDCLPFGCGADYARSIHALGETIVIPGYPAPLPVMPIHPHNLFLQIWLEIGAPGAALFAGALFYGARAVDAAQLSTIEKAAIVAAAASMLFSALVEASMWQVWRISAPALAAMYVATACALRTGRATKPI